VKPEICRKGQVLWTLDFNLREVRKKPVVGFKQRSDMIFNELVKGPC
jgi:hypothetical protein